MKPVIQVSHVSKHFRYWNDRPRSLKSVLVDLMKGRLSWGNREVYSALSDVSFDIYPGEFVGIMGRNGAGKSTLLKLICGIYTPSEGSVRVEEPIAPLIELGAGFSEDLSGYENIFLNAAVLGLGRTAVLSIIDQVIEFSGLSDKIYMPVKNYSSGMLCRLGFSIAAHVPSSILLIDEILAVGDVEFQEKCIRKIKSLHQEGRTVVLITHSPDSVKQVCERCIVIEAQRKIFDGPTEQGVEQYLKLMGH